MEYLLPNHMKYKIDPRPSPVNISLPQNATTLGTKLPKCESLEEDIRAKELTEANIFLFLYTPSALPTFWSSTSKVQRNERQPQREQLKHESDSRVRSQAVLVPIPALPCLSWWPGWVPWSINNFLFSPDEETGCKYFHLCEPQGLPRTSMWLCCGRQELMWAFLWHSVAGFGLWVVAFQPFLQS